MPASVAVHDTVHHRDVSVLAIKNSDILENTICAKHPDKKTTEI
jgi:hypothetical protein